MTSFKAAVTKHFKLGHGHKPYLSFQTFNSVFIWSDWFFECSFGVKVFRRNTILGSRQSLFEIGDNVAHRLDSY